MEYPNLNWGQTDQNNQQFGNGGYGYNNNNTSMDPMSYNVGRYGQAIVLAINDLISNRYIPNQQIANQLYNYETMISMLSARIDYWKFSNRCVLI